MARDQKILLSDSSIEARFWTKVERGDPDECWPWKRARFAAGYGAFGVNQTAYFANRVAYVLANREIIPDGVIVRHKCDNPSCCNPAHLLLGTDADNAADRIARGRSAVGSRNGQSVLTEAAINQIRDSTETQSSLARKFNVSQSLIWQVKHRHVWRAVA